MERIFEQPTPEGIEARRKMYDEAEKLGIDLMAYDETMEELRFTEAELNN